MNEIKNSFLRNDDRISKKSAGYRAGSKGSSASTTATTSTPTSTASGSEATLLDHCFNASKNLSACPQSSPSSSGMGCNKILFKNIKNLKINIPISGNIVTTKNLQDLNANVETPPADAATEVASPSDTSQTHPVQIEQWLKQIIQETEIEPMQNDGILEHSDIHNNSCGPN